MAAPSGSPALPPGYIAEDRGRLTRNVAIAFIVIEFVVVALRILSRRLIKAPLALDDWLIFPSLFFCICLCILAIVEVHVAGVGRHLAVLAVLDPAAIVNWSKCGYAIEQLYCTAVVFPKLSILASYMRIFIERRYRYTAYALAGIIIATGVAGVVASLASCRPFSARWQGLEYGLSHCFNTVVYWRWISFPNIITDAIMLVLPLPIIWGLHLSRTDRIGLTLIFLTGSVGLVTSIVRFTIFFKVEQLYYDGTFISADLAIWSLVEPGIYLLAACLPTLRPLFLHFLGKATEIKNSSGHSSRTAGSIPLDWHKPQSRARMSDEDSIMYDNV